MEKAKVSKMGNKRIVNISKKSGLKAGEEVVITKAFLVDEVKRLDTRIDEKDESFKVALILLASLQVGASPLKIASFLNIPEKEVKKYENNLRESGIWDNNKVACDWFNKKHGGIDFWCDVLVAQGLIKRV